MRRQLVPGLVVRLTVIKAKTRPGIEARVDRALPLKNANLHHAKFVAKLVHGVILLYLVVSSILRTLAIGSCKSEKRAHFELLVSFLATIHFPLLHVRSRARSI